MQRNRDYFEKLTRLSSQEILLPFMEPGGSKENISYPSPDPNKSSSHRYIVVL